MIRLYKLLLILLIIGLSDSVAVAETIDREYQLKSAYLYNIFKFISWPKLATSNDQELELCIFGPDFSNGTLFNLNNKHIDKLTIKVRHTVNINDVESCKVLYITGNDNHIQLQPLVNKGMLLIGEHNNFMAQGGTLNFFIENNRLQFEINLSIAAQAGIKISSKLLRLARIYDNGYKR